MIRAMNREESLSLLRKSRLGRLGCIADGSPYVIPINYLYDGDCVYSHSLPGRKITALRANPRACLQVDEIDDDYRWRSVLVTGRFEEVTNQHERAHILNDLLARLPAMTPVESAVAADAGRIPIIVFRLIIEQVTGAAEG